MAVTKFTATMGAARNWPFRSSLPSQCAEARGVVAPASVEGEGDTHVLSLALAQFRKDWPRVAARLDGMRAKA